MTEKREKIAFVLMISSVSLAFVLSILLVFGVTGFATFDDSDNSPQVSQSLAREGCVDSDSGLNYQIKGIVSSCVGRDCVNSEDFCSSDTLTEYFCQDNKKDSKTYECDELCESGACAGRVTSFTYRGVSGGGGGSSGTTTTVVTVPIISQTFELGALTSEKTIEVLKDDKTYFTISGSEYFITMSDSSPTQVTLIVSGQPQFTLTVGDSKTFDLNSDGTNDAEIWLRSVNIITNKAKISLR